MPIFKKANTYQEEPVGSRAVSPSERIPVSHSLPGLLTAPEIRVRKCGSCRSEVDIRVDNVYTCKACFRFFHNHCSEPTPTRCCKECTNWHENHDKLTVTNLVSVQHLSAFHEIPTATHRLLNAATIEAQRQESWLWKASLEEIMEQSRRIKAMPTLGERIAAKQIMQEVETVSE